MTASKKVFKLAAGILAAVLLVSGLFFLFFKPMYYRFFYPFDRITGTVRITVDGKPYVLKAEDVSGLDASNEKTKVGFRNAADCAILSVHGGEYGPYSLIFHIEGIAAPLEVAVYQYNWYNVCKFDLEIAIDSAAESIAFSSSAKTLSEIGQFEPENHSTTAHFSDKKIVHYVVSV